MMQYSFCNKKKRKKTLTGNLPLPSSEQTKEEGTDITLKYWEQYFRNYTYKVLKLKENVYTFLYSFGSQ